MEKSIEEKSQQLEKLVSLIEKINQGNTNDHSLDHYKTILELEPDLKEKDPQKLIDAVLASVKVPEPKHAVAVTLDYDEAVTGISETNATHRFASKILHLRPTDFDNRSTRNGTREDRPHLGDKATTDYRLKELAEFTQGVTHEKLSAFGQNLPVAKGLEGENNFFDRMRQYASTNGLEIEFNMISSRDAKILGGSPVANQFDNVLGGSYKIDIDGYVVEMVEGRKRDHLLHSALPQDQTIYACSANEKLGAVAQAEGGLVIPISNPGEADYREGSPLEQRFKSSINQVVAQVQDKEELFNLVGELSTKVIPPLGETELPTTPAEQLEKMVSLIQRVHKQDPILGELGSVLAADPDLKDKPGKALERVLSSLEIPKPDNVVSILLDFDGAVTGVSAKETTHRFSDEVLDLPEKRFDELLEQNVESLGSERAGLRTTLNDRVRELNGSGNRVTPKHLAQFGQTSPVADGLEGENNFFDRMRSYAAEKGLDLHFQMVGSRDETILKNSPIAHQFDSIIGGATHGNVMGHIEEIDVPVKSRLLRQSQEDEAETKKSAVAPDQTIYGGSLQDTAVKSFEKAAGHKITIYDETGLGAPVNNVVKPDYRAGSPLEKTFKASIDEIAQRIGDKHTLFNLAEAVKKTKPESVIAMPEEDSAESENLSAKH